MKRILFLLMGLSALALPTRAQKKLTGQQQTQNQTAFSQGFWLMGFSGLTYGGFGDLQKDLDNTTTGLSTDSLPVALNRLGGTYGITGGGLFFRRFIIQGHLNYSDYTETETFRGQVKLRNLSYGASVGYAVWNRNGLLLYPFVGYTIGETRMAYANYSTENLAFGNDPVLKAKTNEYTAPTGLLEVGVSARWEVGSVRYLVVGADLGAYFSAGKSAWENSSTGVKPTGTSDHQLTGAYLRVSIGGGLFQSQKYSATTRRKKPEPAAEPAPAVDDLFAPAAGTTDDRDIRRTGTDQERFKRQQEERARQDQKKKAKPAKDKKRKSSDYDSSEFDDN